MTKLLFYVIFLVCASSVGAQRYDVIIKGGTVYDGSGGKPRVTDIAITGDKVSKIGKMDASHAKVVVNATGLAVSPGFINMLSWSTRSGVGDGWW